MKQRVFPFVIILLCCGFAIFIVMVFGMKTSIRCTRVETDRVDCVAQKRFLGWLPFGKAQTIHDVRRAGTQSHSDDFDNFTAWFVVLYTADEAHTFEFSHYSSAHQAQEQLATFLRGRSEVVEVRDKQGWFIALCGGFLLLSTLIFAGGMVFNILEKSKGNVSSSP